ncbi:MAG: hypothetical protein IKV67_07230 [Paludibacteraceae bacterium]|nr:hypothetical protein [Paludibacteraceae bacterium]
MDKNDLFGIFCIVDGRRIFNSSQLDNSIFHDLGFDKPLYGQNPIPMMDSPNNYELRIMNYELRIDPIPSTVGKNIDEKREEPSSLP